ncbi:MAG: glycine cleavage system aminomethyltransferase GcvT [Acidimicrobiia bacterium]|nr:glycine cleavage system aminomethyltransferase GcvT [Acidimicrobiia bacterium]MYE72837.1 glycine cleavage system aminomethyltransferase GcvT [Acidimicrobiia bacterium]MYJ62288.1 glycine cleavage system aminomethyltransferase GcvT [Acidimicrobiia bacterium]
MHVRSSPLEGRHRALGAKLVPFGGWEMPLSYPSGTLAEHRACRTEAVVFDVSHLGTLRASGPDAYKRLQQAFTNDLARIAPGRTQYTHLLDDDGSVLDDIIVWWVAPESFDVMPNASNTDRVADALGSAETGTRFQAVDVTASRAVLAVQGPEARSRLAQVSPSASEVPRNCVATVQWEGAALTVAGTGYTGEDGVEIAVLVEAAEQLWDAVTAAGIIPAGLGARDTLRLEKGLPLHGHELGPGISPLQAGLGWVVRWDKASFRGREALAAEQERGIHRRLRGLRVEGRRPPREGQSVLRGDEVVGEVTSGNFSPMLETGIALAFVPPDAEIGDELAVDMRGTPTPAAVVKLPFV